MFWLQVLQTSMKTLWRCGILWTRLIATVVYIGLMDSPSFVYIIIIIIFIYGIVLHVTPLYSNYFDM